MTGSQVKYKNMSVFHYQTQNSFGSGAWGFKIEKNGGMLIASEGEPQRGLHVIAKTQYSEEMESQIKQYSDEVRGEAEVVKHEIVSNW